MMGKCAPNHRIQMPFGLWPVNDQKAWSELSLDGDIFDGRGEAFGWSEATRKTNRKHYARWLSWLNSQGLLVLTQTPWESVTPETVEALIRFEINRVSPITVASELIGLKTVILKMQPDGDGQWLRDVSNRINAWAKPVRNNQHRILAADKIFWSAISELNKFKDCPFDRRKDRLEFRNLLMVATLTICPVRISNFAAIRINEHLQQHGDEWRQKFEDVEIKNNTPLGFHIPSSLSPYLVIYLDMIRPDLLGANSHTSLWPGAKGAPLAMITIYANIIATTELLFGVGINPQSFRSIAATWLSERSSSDALFARPLLGHRSPATTERYYIKASKLEASQRVSAALTQLRDA